jgi:iron complex outermembrane receptor protein
MTSVRLALLVSSSLDFVSPALAQDRGAPEPAPASTSDAPAPDDDFHNEIVVTAGGLRRLDMLAGTAVVGGEELQRNLNGQIGEVLTHVPGVSSSSFSPGASRPVLRGFSGDRVRVLVDGLGANDASNVSDDHAVAIEPLTADRIEVLRGPAVLIYGGSAIGGAVNVIDRRIPLRVPEEAVHVDAQVAADTAYDLREGGASADVPLGSTVAFHVDGAYRRTDDAAIAGYQLSDSFRQQVLDEAAGVTDPAEQAALASAANNRGTLPNSATETWSLGSGLAWFGNGASLGASVGYYDTFYEVPTRPGPDAEEDVSIGLKQWRGDLRGSLDLGSGLFEQATTRWAYTDYKHTEFEGDEAGTTFLVDGIEGRVELVQRDRGGWKGSIGGQYSHRDFEAIGDEALVPPNTTSQFGLFALQEVDRGPWGIEFGARYDRTEVGLEDGAIDRGFDTFSGALGLSHELGEGLKVGLNGSRAERAPTAVELFADGAHPATQQFEIGDPNLSKEGSWGLEAYLRGTLGPMQLSVSAFRTWFDDFIFLQATGGEEDGLPVYQQMQQDADYAGIEGEITVPVFRSGGVTLIADGKGDYIRATLADGSPVPRIPPLSLLGGLELQSARWDARTEVEWYDSQHRVAGYETPTGSYAFVNASLAWKPLRGGDNVTVMLQANNLFDTEGRRHASFTKDFVPLAGRNVKLSVRTSF